MELTDLGKAPVPGSAPAGAGVAGTPALEALEGEVAKLASVAGAAGGPDWDRVVALSAQLLEGFGKDLKVAAYLCAGLAQTRAQEGVAVGLHVLRDLLETWWTPMTPARPRARRNTVEWLAERIEQVSAGWPAATWPASRRQAFLDDGLALDAFLGEHLEDAPTLRPLVQRLARTVEEATSAPAPAAAAQPPAPATPAAPPPVPVPAAAAASRPDLPAEDPQRLLAQALDDLRGVAGLLLDRTPEAPVPYVLNRTAAWAGVQAPPPEAGGRTRIPPPGAQETQPLRMALQAGNWALVAANGEALLPANIFWLDLNRLVTEALDHLGRPLAARAVERETRALVRRLPGLDRLCYTDGTPFADEATRQWLRAGDGPAEAAPAGGEEAALTEAQAQAEALVQAGDLPGALASLAGRVRAAGSARTALRLKQATCSLLLRAGRTRAAEAFARDLLADLEAFQVHRWEPDLAAAALRAALPALRAGPGDDGLAARTLDRLALLDPAGVPT